MSIDISRVKAICFDVDGTLSDSDDQFVLNLARWLAPLKSINRGFDIKKLARRLVMMTEGPGNWAYSLADRLGLDGVVITMGNFLYELGHGRSSQPFQLVTGTRQMLAQLSAQYPLGIISIRGERTTYRFLTQFELFPYFSAIATGQTCRHTKPYPEPLQWVAQKMDVPPASCLMVGDTSPDIIMGKKAGAQTVGVLCGFGERQELEYTGADLILDCTSDLTGYLVKA